MGWHERKTCRGLRICFGTGVVPHCCLVPSGFRPCCFTTKILGRLSTLPLSKNAMPAFKLFGTQFSPLFYSVLLYKPLIAQISSLLWCWGLMLGLILVMLPALLTPEPRCGMQRNSSEGSQRYFYSLFAFGDSAGAGLDGSVHTAQPTLRYFCARGTCGLCQSTADVWHSTALCSGNSSAGETPLLL